MLSPLAVTFHIALDCLRVEVSLLVYAALLQGAYLQTETHTQVERERHEITSRRGRASSVLTPLDVSGSSCAWEIGRMA